MDLHSGTPYWLMSSGLGLVVPALAGDAEVDVAIIGGGITGALLADSLSRSGLRVAVLDRRDLGTGSTGASTALLQYDTDVPLSELGPMMGDEAAARVFRLGVGAVKSAIEIARELDCPAAQRRSLYLCTRKEDIEFFDRELPARSRAGLDCRWLTARELESGWGIIAHGAILSGEAGETDPYRLCHALLRRAIAQGALVHDRTAVEQFWETDNGWVLLTPTGKRVKARFLVHATGYESAAHLPNGLVTLSSTYALATEPTRPPEGKWADRAIVWEHASPYLYARWTDDRLLIGGEDVAFKNEKARDALLDKKTGALVAKAAALIPGVRIEPAFAWTGTFAATRDSLGYIGPLPGHDTQFFALGFGGNGITFSVLAADMLTDRLLGRTNPDAALFAFDRPTAGADEP